tara:strand:- start:795 stop:1118 length:324 start_codon:yes stop_codon:yes gene_type:complete
MIDVFFPLTVILTGYLIPSLVTLAIVNSTGLKREKDTIVSRFIGPGFLVMIVPAGFFALICLVGINDFGFETIFAAYLSIILLFGAPLVLLLMGVRLLFLNRDSAHR